MLRGLVGLGSLPRFVVYTLLAGMLVFSGLSGELEVASTLDACTAGSTTELLASEGLEGGEVLGGVRGGGSPNETPAPDRDDSEDADGEAEDAPELGAGLRPGIEPLLGLARAVDATRFHARWGRPDSRRTAGRHGARAPPARG